MSSMEVTGDSDLQPAYMKFSLFSALRAIAAKISSKLDFIFSCGRKSTGDEASGEADNGGESEGGDEATGEAVDGVVDVPAPL